MTKYLTEENLKEFLKLLYPDHTFINDRCYGKGHLFRPDFVCPDLKLVVEFDGSRHYTQSKVIVTDHAKEEIMNGDGYEVIRIPYFVQMSVDTIKHYFNKDMPDYKQVYPHGFVDPKCTLPADFCELGVERFIKQLKSLPAQVQNDINESLQSKVLEHTVACTLPLSWEHHGGAKFSDGLDLLRGTNISFDTKKAYAKTIIWKS